MSGDRFSVVVPRPLFTGHGWIFVLPMGPTPARWGPASDPVGSASDRAADLASAQTSQGLTLKSGGSYDQSLQLEALNRVANQALELERIREHPGFYADYTYFDEKGTNRNVDIALQRLPGRRPIFWECSHPDTVRWRLLVCGTGYRSTYRRGRRNPGDPYDIQ